MRHINTNFNQHILGSRPIPPTPEGLAERIIARARTMPVEGNILMMLLLPRPFIILSFLFVMAFLAGFGVDLGFNSADEFSVNEQDILYSFEGDIL